MSKDNPLFKYATYIERMQKLSVEIGDLRPRAPLNLLSLDTAALQADLADRATRLAQLLTGRSD